MVESPPQEGAQQQQQRRQIMAAHTASARAVHFGTVIVHSFPCGLGDNPSVRGGPPICLDYHSKSTYCNLDGNNDGALQKEEGGGAELGGDVVVYTVHEHSALEKRHGMELCVPPGIRREWVLKHCAETADSNDLDPETKVAEVERAVRHAQLQRRMTIALQEHEHFQLLFQSLSKLVKRFLLHKKTRANLSPCPATQWILVHKARVKAEKARVAEQRR